ncbi:MAG TPA: ATP-binding protein [Acidimicrobiia bacterium]|nr:ATP-binding protein [Acidimicrobiia bacterium]
MSARFEVSVPAARDGALALDAASARDLDFFLSHVSLSAPVTRPVVVWRGTTRNVVDVTASIDDDGIWRLDFGAERPDGDAPDRPEMIDPRLESLSTMVWVTDANRLARFFNSAWCNFVGTKLDDELGWGWMQHIQEDDLIGLLAAYEAGHVGHHGFDHAVRMRDRSNTLWWLRVRAVPRLSDGVFDGFLGICTPLRRADDEDPPSPSTVPQLLPPLGATDSASGTVERLANLEAALEIKRPAETIEAVCLRRLASNWTAQHRVLEPRHDDIVLAVGEATANAAIHAYRDDPGLVQLECAMHESFAEFRVRDWGAWREARPSGDSRGIHIMQALADEFEIRHHSDGTEVLLRFRIVPVG